MIMKYPSIEDLRERARQKIPRFAFEYLDGGCNEDVNLYKNTAEIREIELKPYYLTDHTASSMKTELSDMCMMLLSELLP